MARRELLLLVQMVLRLGHQQMVASHLVQHQHWLRQIQEFLEEYYQEFQAVHQVQEY
jgi:hypothetical protein